MKLPPTTKAEFCFKEASKNDDKIEPHPQPFPLMEIYVDNNRDGPSIKEYRRDIRSGHLRVTFEVDESDQIRALEAEAAVPSTTSATLEDKRDLWWSRKELAKIWNREQTVCDFHRLSEDDYVDQVRHIFSRCTATVGTNTTKGGAAATETTKTADAQLLAARSSNRGLELRVVHMLQLHRERVLRGVLDQQAKVAHLKNVHQRHQMIRSKSTYLSRSAKAFALTVAAADAIVAQAALGENIKDLITLEQLSESCLLCWEQESFVLSDSLQQWGESFRWQLEEESLGMPTAAA